MLVRAGPIDQVADGFFAGPRPVLESHLGFILGKAAQVYKCVVYQGPQPLSCRLWPGRCFGRRRVANLTEPLQIDPCRRATRGHTLFDPEQSEHECPVTMVRWPSASASPAA